jgi:hypothetical protein
MYISTPEGDGCKAHLIAGLRSVHLQECTVVSAILFGELPPHEADLGPADDACVRVCAHVRCVDGNSRARKTNAQMKRLAHLVGAAR